MKTKILKTIAKIISTIATIIAVSGLIMYAFTTMCIVVLEHGTTFTNSLGVFSGVLLGAGVLLGITSVLINYKESKITAKV